MATEPTSHRHPDHLLVGWAVIAVLMLAMLVLGAELLCEHQTSDGVLGIALGTLGLAGSVTALLMTLAEWRAERSES